MHNTNPRRARLLVITLLTVFALFTAACGDDDTTTDTAASSSDSGDAGDPGGAGESAGADLEGEFLVSGSSTVYPIVLDQAEDFAAANPGVAISVEGPGSAAAQAYVEEEVTNVEQMSGAQAQEGSMPQNLLTSSRQVIQTTNGLVNKEAVRQIMTENIAPDAPTVKMISSNQSQEYFTVATQTGFEIIQNDSSSDKIRKKTRT